LVAVGFPLAYPQAKNEGPERIHQTRRTFPLSKFYDAPNPLPSQKAGDLIRSEKFDDYDLPSGVLAVRILYHSRSASGQDVAASGVVLYPDAKPPAGGWPVIAWAHALNGVARTCAPSLARNVEAGPILAMYVNLGYAAVATDYTGLGSSFRNAFSDTQSNATDVIYSVTAARAAVTALDSRWVAIGIGQGGAVVVALAELEREIRDPHYLGSIAVSGLDDPQDRYGHSSPPAFPDTPLFLAYGIKTVYPRFDVKDMLTDKAFALYAKLSQACTDSDRQSRLSPAEILKPNWASNKFVRQYFSRDTLGQKPAQGPLLVISSELDPSIPIQRTALAITRMCKQGDRVQFERYPQSEADRLFGDSVRDQISWLQARFSGQAAPSNCFETR
jgi:hypothetical protein